MLSLKSLQSLIYWYQIMLSSVMMVRMRIILLMCMSITVLDKIHQADCCFCFTKIQQELEKDFQLLEINEKYQGAFCRCAESLKLLGLKLHKEMVHMDSRLFINYSCKNYLKIQSHDTYFQNFWWAYPSDPLESSMHSMLHTCASLTFSSLALPSLTHGKLCHAPSGLSF